MPTHMDILKCPMPPNDADAATVGEYLSLLLSTLWLQGESFSGKRPFGNSGWHYDVYLALIRAGIVEGVLDEDGYIDEFEYEIQADELILRSIRMMGKG